MENTNKIKSILERIEIKTEFTEDAIDCLDEIVEYYDIESLDDAYDHISEAVDNSDLIYYSNCFQYLSNHHITDFSEAIDEAGAKDVTGIAMYYLDREIYDLIGKVSELLEGGEEEEEEEEE